ncbi:MAG: HlyD family secretion protein [Paraglaciecola sp.]|jgi:HlyD family secretion protein
MQAINSRKILWTVITTLLFIVLLYLFWPRGVIVDMAQVKKGALQVTVADEAKTRVHDTYVLSAPITGYLRRIELEVGDPVLISSTTVAQIEPIDPAFLDPRSEAQAKADIQAADSAKSLAKAEVSQAQAELDFALSEVERMRKLRIKNSVSARELDNAERAYKFQRAALATTQAALQMRNYELERVEALLLSPTSTQKSHGHCPCLNIIAPINGHILRVFNKSAGVVTAGTPLVEIGDPQDLEIVVELLSFDAVNVQPGQKVTIENWGGTTPLNGVVNRIEPIGFLKVSALGIEEQRVNVIVTLQSDPELWQRLGHGYQVDVKIMLWEGSDLLTIPITALFRDEQHWAVFLANNNVVEKRRVQIGRKNAFAAQIISGLNEGDWFILYPNDQLADGVSISSRASLSKS